MLGDSSTETYWAGPTTRQRTGTVRVFDHDPDLLAGLDPDTAQLLCRHAVVPGRRLACGSWSPPPEDGRSGGVLGLLVLDGLLSRSTCLYGRTTSELLGPGDLLQPWEPAGTELVEAESSWRVLQPTTLAILDARFSGLLCAYPSVMAALFARSTVRCRGLALHLAIVHIRRAETRLLTLLWYLAARWGRMTAQGVVLPLPLTHQLLSELACLRRPTTSTALQRLVRAGEIARRADHGWLLLGEPHSADTEQEPAVPVAA